ncbi:protein SRC2-like [Panicum miliaceum]|uniref:Protein SRC2-like n=1 Tax=Panicum miliaceum TaxID=4540 RepID=A0A3L6SVY4_PANMI|nr:protein SRC2-like [Panicum miliaceum]
MAYRVLEVTLVSANDLKKVTHFTRLRVYAVASISDTRGLAVHVRHRAERAYFGDRDVGEVFVPLDDLLAGADKGVVPRPVSYQVRRPHSGRAHGVLYFCYKFTDVQAAGLPEPAETKQGQYAKYVQDSEKAADRTMSPPTAYRPPQAMSSGYPPVQYGYGSPYAAYPPHAQQPYAYAAPPAYGYNAAPHHQPAMYGYGYAPAPARHGGGMGMGLGLGLLGGAVGGMMIGEMVGDFEADAAYDAGFNDALEF